jgi:hypothetical protein
MVKSPAAAAVVVVALVRENMAVTLSVNSLELSVNTTSS